MSYPDDVVAVMRDTISAQRQALASKDAVIAEQRAELERLKAKFAGPRCDICGNLCVDLAKDEHGRCPDCSALEGVTP